MNTVCVFIIVIFCRFMSEYSLKKQYEKENKSYQLTLQQQKDYYSNLLYKDELKRKFIHDINNHLGCIRHYLYIENYSEAKNYISEIIKDYQKTKPEIETGNEVLNAVNKVCSQMLTKSLRNLKNTQAKKVTFQRYINCLNVTDGEKSSRARTTQTVQRKRRKTPQKN